MPWEVAQKKEKREKKKIKKKKKKKSPENDPGHRVMAQR